MENKCEMCDCLFLTRKPSKKFCSDKCWQLDYYQRNGDRIRQRANEYSSKWGVKKPKELWVYNHVSEDEKRERRLARDKERYKSDPIFRQKQLARIRANNALISGKITRLPCQKCGEVKSEMHHADYSKPYDVTWLCRIHHNELHMTDPFPSTISPDCGEVAV